MDNVIDLAGRALDASHKRQELISNNIANASTPHYRRQDLNFLDNLKQELAGRGKRTSLRTTHPDHQVSTYFNKGVSVTELTDFIYRNDKNNVDVEVEMAELVKNNLYYNTLINQVNRKYTMLRNVIDQGGK